MKKLLIFMLLIVSSSYMYGQLMVSGRIVDIKGEAIIGANVIVKEAPTIGTITDLDGMFKLGVPSEGTVLTVSYTGYQTLEVPITGTYLDIVMEEGKVLDEIVVIGYGENSTRFNTQSVSAIGENGIKDRPVFSPQELLQGQAAGVQMVNSSGLIGANSSVRIRGAASITGGGEPLYVLDGVPLNDRNMSNNQGGGTGLNPLMNINANDIENISVLKDASAVAIYGSRGANGVILITTKKGKKGSPTRFNVSANTGITALTDQIEMMDVDQFATFSNEYRAAQGAAPREFPTQGFDWQDAVTRQGNFNSVNVSASGGDNSTSYYIGGTFRKESGFTIGNDARNLSGRLNLNHQANKWLSIGANMSVSNIDMDRIGSENNTFAPQTSSLLQLPFVQAYNEDGTFRNTGFIQNVIAIEALNDNRYITNRLTSNVYANVNLYQNSSTNLVFRTDWGIDRFSGDTKGRTVNLFTPGGSGYYIGNSDNKWLSTNTLNFTKDMGGNSSFGVLAGYSFETSRFQSLELAGTGFALDDFRNLSSASTPTTASESTSEWGLASQFLRASYNHSGKYLVEGTVRRDGSSRFGANNRYGIFWAASAGWILSEESFMEYQNFFDFLKLTASYGIAGNDRIGDFSSLALYGAGVAADYDGTAGIRPIQIPYPDLTWEETSQFDVGLSTRFLQDRIGVNVNYYNKITDGLLLNVPFPYTTGFTSASQNVGSMKNTGVDLEINANILRKENLIWNIGFNTGYLKNEVLELPENADAEGNNFIDGSASQRAVVGRSLNEFYLVRANGVNPTTGDFEWLDLEGNPTTTYSASNRVYVGSAIPKFTGGINTNLEAYGFDLGLLFSFTYGNKVMIDGLRFTDNMGSEGFNHSTDLLDYWRAEGDQSFAPSLASPTARLFNQRSTLQLQDGSFLRLRNLTLGYTIPQNLLSKQSILNGARVYILGQNLWLLKNKDFRGADPEVSANGTNNQIQGESFFALPQAKIFTFGVNFNF